MTMLDYPSVRSAIGTDSYLAESMAATGDGGDGADIEIRGPFAGWDAETHRPMWADVHTDGLSILARCVAHLAERAAQVCPTRFATEPDRVMAALLATIVRGGTGDRLMSSAEAIAAMVPDEYLNVDEIARGRFLVELVQGEPDDDLAADETPLVRFHTTERLPAVNVTRNSREYRQTRRLTRIPILASTGDVTDALDARRVADDLLAGRAVMVEGAVTPVLEGLANAVPSEYRLIGSADGAWPQSIEHKPDVISQDPEMSAEGFYRRRLLKADVAVGSKYKPNGQRTGATPIGRPDRPTYRQTGRNGESLVTLRRINVAKAPALLGRLLAPTFGHAAPIIVTECHTAFRGQHLTGHGHWWMTRDGRAARAARAAAAQSAADAMPVSPDLATYVAGRLHTASAGSAFSVRSTDGHRLTVAVRANGTHRLTFTARGGKAVQVSAGRDHAKVLAKVRQLTTA